MNRTRILLIDFQLQCRSNFLYMVQQKGPYTAGLASRRDEKPFDIVLAEACKALDTVLVFIDINLRLWQHRLHHIEVLPPVVRRYKIVRFSIALQPYLRDTIDISFL